jgi:hypothetical protein
MDFQGQILNVGDRLIPKESVQFFGIPNSKDKHIVISISSKPEVWQEDLVIAERIFADFIICPFKDYTNHTIAYTLTKNVLQQRMKYPDIKENPELMKIAKTWILPNRVHMGPDASQFFCLENGPLVMLSSIFEKLETKKVINYLKIEVDDGMERNLVYSILDSGFRPGLFCVKWTHDVDEHLATAHCVGHLINSGYRMIKQENGYSLYYFIDDVIYDICSVKDPSLDNPFIKNITEILNKRFQQDLTDYVGILERVASSEETKTNENSGPQVDGESIEPNN